MHVFANFRRFPLVGLLENQYWSTTWFVNYIFRNACDFCKCFTWEHAMHLDVNSPLEIMQVVEEPQEQPTETDIASQEGYIWVPKGLDSSQVRVFFSVILSKNCLFFVLDEIHTVLTQRIRLYSKMFNCIQMIYYLINACNSRISFFL